MSSENTENFPQAQAAGAGPTRDNLASQLLKLPLRPLFKRFLNQIQNQDISHLETETENNFENLKHKLTHATRSQTKRYTPYGSISVKF